MTRKGILRRLKKSRFVDVTFGAKIAIQRELFGEAVVIVKLYMYCVVIARLYMWCVVIAKLYMCCVVITENVFYYQADLTINNQTVPTVNNG